MREAGLRTGLFFVISCRLALRLLAEYSLLKRPLERFGMVDALLALMLMMQSAPTEPAAPQTATETAQEAPVDATAEPELDPNEMVCRSERVVGSNIPVRTCQRRSELEGRSERTGQQMRDRRGLTRALSERGRGN